MMCDNDKDTFCSHAGTLCRFLVVQEPSPLERGGVHYLRHESIFQKLHLSDPVSNGKKVLDWLEGKGSRLVGEPVQQGLLEGQVGRVQRLEDVRLKTVARATFESFSYGYDQGRYKNYHFGHVFDRKVESVM